MPRLEVEYWSNYGNRWEESESTGRYETVDYLAQHLSNDGSTAPRRARFPGEEWEFVPYSRHPYRYVRQEYPTSVDSHRVNLRCFEPEEFPVLDLFTREVFNFVPAPSESEIIMPNPVNAAPAANSTPDALVDIRVTREAGKLILLINARNLHDLLDSVGCKTDGGRYTDQPTAIGDTIRNGKISPALFLRKDYPLKLAIAQFYSTPATYDELVRLCESGHDAVRTILAHYQPVDISFTINKIAAK